VFGTSFILLVSPILTTALAALGDIVSNTLPGGKVFWHGTLPHSHQQRAIFFTLAGLNTLNYHCRSKINGTSLAMPQYEVDLMLESKKLFSREGK